MAFGLWLQSSVAQHWKNRPDQIILEDSSGKEISFKEFENKVLNFKKLISEHTIPGKNIIAIHLPQGLPMALAIYACLENESAGCVIEKDLLTSELDRWQNDLKADAIITSKTNFKNYWMKYEHHLLIPIPFMDDLSQEPLFLIVMPKTDRLQMLQDVAWLLATSGSSGYKKFVMLGSDDLISRVQGEIELLHPSSGKKILNILPFSHDLGFHQLLSTLASGASLFLSRLISPAAIWNQLQETHFAGLTATPQVWILLMDNFADEVPIKNLEYLTVSGGSLSESRLERLSKLFPSTKIFKTYGQTETFRSLAYETRPGDVREGLGYPIAGVQLFLMNEEMQLCAPLEIGQLIHAGSGTMLGYYGDTKLTEQKLTNRGVMTGDYFYQDEMGVFHFCGRKDDMIKRKGYRIYIQEIEDKIITLPMILNAAIIIHSMGVDEDPEITAFVVLKSESELKSFEDCLVEKFPPYQKPDKIKYMQALPLGSSGKVDRMKLKNLCAF